MYSSDKVYVLSDDTLYNKKDRTAQNIDIDLNEYRKVYNRKRKLNNLCGE